jgi:hypothetical protein
MQYCSWKILLESSIRTISYSISASSNCTHEYVHDLQYYVQWKWTIHQSLHSPAFTQLKALLRIGGRWPPIIISMIVPLLIPPPIGKSTSWATNTQRWYWKPLSLKMGCYFPWRIDGGCPKWWSIMTIICWALMKSEETKSEVNSTILSKHKHKHTDAAISWLVQSHELTRFSENCQHYFMQIQLNI